METPQRKKSPAEEMLEQTLEGVEAKIRQLKQEKIQAEEELDWIEGDKKPFFTNKMLKIGALAAGLATVGGVGIKRAGDSLNWWGSNASKEKVEQKDVKLEQKKELSYEKLKLPEEDKKIIEEILSFNQRRLINQQDTNIIKSLEAQTELLKSEPIKYFTDEVKNMDEVIKFIASDTKDTEQSKAARSADFIAEKEKFQKVIVALEIANQEANTPPAPYISTATNMTGEMRRLAEQTNTSVLEKPAPIVTAKETVPATAPAPDTKPPTTEEITAKVRAELEAKYAKELAEYKATNSAPVVPQKPVAKTHEELILEIRAKLGRGEKITAEEAMMHNRELIKRRPPAALGGYIISTPPEQQ